MNLQKIIRKHRAWLLGIPGVGQKANLRNADLRNADLQYADLRNADLRNADLQYADLRNADLQYADLQYANLQYADLQYANLRNADLQYADLRNADLRNATLDMSSGIPFHCGGTKIKGCDRLFSQMIYHLTRQNWEISEENQKFLDSIPKSVLNSFCKYRTDLEEV